MFEFCGAICYSVLLFVTTDCKTIHPGDDKGTLNLDAIASDDERLKCQLCGNVSSAESIKATQLKRCFEIKIMNKPRFFTCRELDLDKVCMCFKKVLTVSERALTASWEVSYIIAETLILERKGHRGRQEFVM